MTTDEIFAELSAHMVKGLMVHDQLANYFCFLNLKGYATCHTYHYLSENKEYVELNHYYHRAHYKLIKSKSIEDPKVIPVGWYEHMKDDVDATTKKSGIKQGLEIWIGWEEETLKLYSKMYKELLDSNEIADARYIGNLVDDVAAELAHAKSMYILLQSCNFDLAAISEVQEDKAKRYMKKIEEIWR